MARTIHGSEVYFGSGATTLASIYRAHLESAVTFPPSHKQTKKYFSKSTAWLRSISSLTNNNRISQCVRFDIFASLIDSTQRYRCSKLVVVLQLTQCPRKVFILRLTQCPKKLVVSALGNICFGKFFPWIILNHSFKQSKLSFIQLVLLLVYV